MRDPKYGTYYECATGSITGTHVMEWQWTVPVWPDNDGSLWTYDPDTGKKVIVDD